MTSHIETKRRIKSIADINIFNDIVSRLNISSIDKEILDRIYVKQQDINFIADTLGYSEKTVRRKHVEAVKKIMQLI